jgi:hypothetical protein
LAAQLALQLGRQASDLAEFGQHLTQQPDARRLA